MAQETDRYTGVAIGLHWLIAALIVGQILGGWVMTDEATPRAQAFQMFQLHKSFGFTILALSLVRLVWRFAHPPPALPPGMKGWEIAAARLTHVGFYALMIGIPLSGWVLVSTAPYSVTTLWFGLFEVPKLPFLPDLEGKKAVNEAAESAHSALAWATIVLLGLHVGAALKHHFIDKDGVLARMLPFLKARSA
jgi:cytochrome b561